jgi:hypothetical protein
MLRWRVLALVGLSLVTWPGCSGKSSHEAPKPAVGRAGAAGKSSASAGKGAAGQGGGGAAGGAGTEAGAAGSDNEGGRGAEPSSGGMSAAGRSAAGGTFGMGAFAGTFSNTAGSAMSGASGAINVPSAWGCLRATYGDGKCDCGCWAPDIDCTKADLDHCDVCNAEGSCNRGACPGNINPDDITRCTPPPDGWTCTPAAYNDGSVCDCACGIRDPDCKDGKLSSCDSCATVGSCANGACPSDVSSTDNSQCEVPLRWVCEARLYGDGHCDCGCGMLDIDCADATYVACQACHGCSDASCNTIDQKDNSICTAPPASWTCSPRLYRDTTQCDCGCGFFDPDCDSPSVDACDRCNDNNSCSLQACPGIIDPDMSGSCKPPPPPPEWTCYPYQYGGNQVCDCGCGAPDIDCATSDIELCAQCSNCGGIDCRKTVKATDTTQCNPPTADWTCPAKDYTDITCDCGCGVPDPRCNGIEDGYACQNYPVEGCSGGIKSHIDPNHNAECLVSVPSGWTCNRGYFGDGLCDCGCGAVDADCSSPDAAACKKCDNAGSCSSANCPGTILPSDNAHCSN